MLITLFIIVTIGFMVIRLMPGNTMYADDPDMSAAQIEVFRAKYHLDKPVPVQYVIFLRAYCRGTGAHQLACMLVCLSGMF